MFIVYCVVGLLFVLMVSLWGIAVALGYIFEQIRRRRDSNFTWAMLQSLSGIRRWCSYEYPQMEFMADELIEASIVGWQIDSSKYRDKAREKFPAIVK